MRLAENEERVESATGEEDTPKGSKKGRAEEIKRRPAENKVAEVLTPKLKVP